eukprot:gnl/TRDRNA2_/TRDRNA2_209535_c0_seq1.p1 gnl/TRDRNA2_/TRDRNA2_209535_c0~~gnl/TRDRNA2_/TRDRNA2_209535_c0_seq1.p1  ORF type:complete len:356 (+),score=48.44 gnl/TRDRNA2_/TRDRNA2_209535_c0_seq1:122-1069(+)
MLLFGQELYEFSNFTRAANTIFRMMLGDFDWDRMSRVGRPQAGFIFWTFNWLVNLVLLNMLLAIIMDVYTEVKGGIGSHSETMWSQVAEIYDRTREVRAGNQMTLSAVLKALDPTDLDDADDHDPDEPNVMISSFQAAVPGLSEEQATEILVAAQTYYESQARPSESLTDCTLKISRIDDFILKMHESLQKLIQINNMEAGMQIAGSKEHRAEAQLLPQIAHGLHVDEDPQTAILERLDAFRRELHNQNVQMHQLLQHHTGALLDEFTKRLDGLALRPRRSRSKDNGSPARDDGAPAGNDVSATRRASRSLAFHV